MKVNRKKKRKCTKKREKWNQKTNSVKITLKSIIYEYNT